MSALADYGAAETPDLTIEEILTLLRMGEATEREPESLPEPEEWSLEPEAEPRTEADDGDH